jgi:hypothetical protein
VPDTDQPAVVAGGPALIGQYEQLREVALAGHADGWRHGLGVLAARGVAGWMAVCQSVPPAAPTPPASPTRSTDSGALAERAGELVSVMAAMALAHL